MVTYEDILVVAVKNHTLEECALIFEVSTRTIQRVCDANLTKYGNLRPKGKKKLNTKNGKVTYDKLKKDPDVEQRIKLLETKKKFGSSGSSGGKNGSPPNTQKKNSEETGELYDKEIKNIDEEFYQEYLKEVIASYPPSIKILTEVRNYLDKKQELKPANQSILEMTPEQIHVLSKGLEEVH